MIYDEEQMIRDIETLFKAKLNAEIDCINTEKGAVSGDVLFLEQIPDTSYIFETIDKKLLNFKGFFVLYGLIDYPVEGANIESYIEGTTVTFQVGTFDKGDLERSNILYKLLRYRRAISQVIMKNPDVFRGYAKPLVTRLKPDSLPFDRNYVILKSGVDIKASNTSR